MDKNELLQEQTREKKDPQTMLISTWPPKLKTFPSI